MAGTRPTKPIADRGRPRTLFAKMWQALLILMLVIFVVHALLVTGTL